MCCTVYKYFYVILDLVGNNNNSIPNCVFYITKKINKSKDTHKSRRNLCLKEIM